jgi:hypothetical protein
VYLNELSVQELITAREEQEDLANKVAKKSAPTEALLAQLTDAEAKIDAAVEKLKAEEYIITIQGISPERYVELENDAVEAFAREYEESVHPLTGAKIKTEIENEERDTLLSALVRREHIIKVTAPDGSVDEDFSDIEKVKSVWNNLPLLARMKIDNAINESTIQVDFYRELVDEVF